MNIFYEWGLNLTFSNVGWEECKHSNRLIDFRNDSRLRS